MGTDPLLDSLDANMLDALSNATFTARVAAGKAAKAALDIRKMIGGPESPSNRYIWFQPPRLGTLVEIEEQFRQLGEQVSFAVRTWPMYRDEMAVIESRIVGMLQVVSRNTAVAEDAAVAAERLHTQVVNFVRMVERSGLFLSDGLE